MNTQFKVGQRVRVITGANVTPEILDGKTGIIADIDYAPSIEFVGLNVKFDNGLQAWCHKQKDKGIVLNVEILKADTFSATIEFKGDMSVGIRPYYYTMDLDANLIEVFADDKAYREELRGKIQALYTEIDGEMKCHVIFSDETID
jgi:hypothetical protein